MSEAKEIIATQQTRTHGGACFRIGLNRSKGSRVVFPDEQSADFPPGSRRLEIYFRSAGDHYAEVEGEGYFVSATGEGWSAAAQAVAAKCPKKADRHA